MPKRVMYLISSRMHRIDMFLYLYLGLVVYGR